MTRLPHPDAITRIPMTRRAEIHECDGWWCRYVVHRTAGIAIPENSASLHRSLNGARRAARRWAERSVPDGSVETYAGSRKP